MNHLASSIKAIAILIKPFMKDTSDNILMQLGLGDKDYTFDDLEEYNNFDGVKVIEKGVPIFVRLDEAEEVEYIKSLMGNK